MKLKEYQEKMKQKYNIPEASTNKAYEVMILKPQEQLTMEKYKQELLEDPSAEPKTFLEICFHPPYPIPTSK